MKSGHRLKSIARMTIFSLLMLISICQARNYTNNDFQNLEKRCLAGDHKSFDALRKSAEEGNDLAQICMGNYYQSLKVFADNKLSPDDYRNATDRLIYQNNEIAFGWYKRAAEGGNSEAQQLLGTMYENGSGTPKDKASAIEWYRKSSAQGNDLAKRNLEFLVSSEETPIPENCFASGFHQELLEQIPVALDLQGQSARIVSVHATANLSRRIYYPAQSGAKALYILQCPVQVAWDNGLSQVGYFSEWQDHYGQVKVAFGDRPVYPR